MTNAVIYEVNLTPAREINADFRAWLPLHVEEMLTLPGFTGARILDPEEQTSEEPDTLTVHYRLKDRDALEQYFRQYAHIMREKTSQRFGDAVTANRRVLLPTDNSAPPGDADLCQNCKARLEGQYCSSCGQRQASRILGLGELFRDLIGDLFELDSRLWRSLIPLITKPGFLTKEYLSGKRVHYTPPLRMYLVLSILFFLVATFDLEFLDSVLSSTEVETPEQTALQEAERLASLQEQQEECSEIRDDLDGFAGRLGEAVCIRVSRDEGENFANELVDNIPAMMFVFLPLLAVVMKLLYLGSKRYYVEHLLFLVHFHSAFFLMMAFLIFYSRALTIIPWHGLWMGLLIAALVIYSPIYLFKSIRLVYGQNAFFVITKMFFLFIAYISFASITFAIGAALTAIL